MTLRGSALLDAHLKGMMDGFASSEVKYAGQTTRGLLDDEETLTDSPEGIVRNRQRVLTVRAASLNAAPTRDATITVDGAAFTVRSVEPQGDGLHWRILVA